MCCLYIMLFHQTWKWPISRLSKAYYWIQTASQSIVKWTFKPLALETYIKQQGKSINCYENASMGFIVQGQDWHLQHLFRPLGEPFVPASGSWWGQLCLSWGKGPSWSSSRKWSGGSVFLCCLASPLLLMALWAALKMVPDRAWKVGTHVFHTHQM